MSTSCNDVYDAFLAKLHTDEWFSQEDELVMQDWKQLLDAAIFRFKYPRVSLENDGEDFYDDLSNDEIQLLALYMKDEWLQRCITEWDKVHFLYTDKDFSQANFLDKLVKTEAALSDKIHEAVGIYDRSRNKRPTEKFKQLAGKQHG